jgi:hypothetical protein
VARYKLRSEIMAKLKRYDPATTQWEVIDAANADTVTTNANLTGDVTSVGNATSIAAGVIVNADINVSAGIDTTKLANGSVTNTEFQYLDGVTSEIQTQIGTLSSLPTTDQSSTVSAITEIWNYPISNMTRQAIINGNFDVWQRGISFTNPAPQTYTSDRIVVVSNPDSGVLPTTLTHSRLSLTSGDLQGSYFGYRITTDGAGSSFGVNAIYGLNHRIEYGTRYLCGNGKKVTVSFYAKSNISGKRIGVNIYQNYGTGGSPTSLETITGQILTLTSSWVKYTVTFTTNTLVGKTFGTNNDDYLQLRLSHIWGTTTASNQFGGGTAETFGGAGNIDIAQVQVNAGDQALPFQPRSFAEELALCQRYYEKSYAYGVAPATASNNIGIESRVVPSNTIANGQLYGKTSFKVKKRTLPTMTIYPLTTPTNTGRISDASGTDLAAASGTASFVGDDGFGVQNNSGGAITTAVNTVVYHWAADTEL